MSSVVWRKKKLATVIVGLFSLKENAPTKNENFGRGETKIWREEGKISGRELDLKSLSEEYLNHA